MQLDKAKLKTIRLLFPLHREGLSSYLSPILGQYAIKNADFINDFITAFTKYTDDSFANLINVDSLETGGVLYDETLFVPLLLNVYRGGKFSIKVTLPALGFLFSSSFKKRRRIYKRLLRGEVSLLRNYKKLFQITIFKMSKVATNNNTEILEHYKQVRNALYQTN